jgi:hypothetical protein
MRKCSDASAKPRRPASVISECRLVEWRKVVYGVEVEVFVCA